MSARAQVTSVDAIASFRAQLITYLAAARPTVDELISEVMRVRIYLDEDRRRYWEREVLRRGRVLHDAEAALFSARMSGLREATSAEVMAVSRAKGELEAAQERLRRVKFWSREFETRIGPLGRHLDGLRNLLTVDMGRGVAALDQTLDLLNDYAGAAAPVSAPPPNSPTGNEPPAEASGAATSELEGTP